MIANSQTTSKNLKIDSKPTNELVFNLEDLKEDQIMKMLKNQLNNKKIAKYHEFKRALKENSRIYGQYIFEPVSKNMLNFYLEKKFTEIKIMMFQVYCYCPYKKNTYYLKKQECFKEFLNENNESRNLDMLLEPSKYGKGTNDELTSRDASSLSNIESNFSENQKKKTDKKQKETEHTENKSTVTIEDQKLKVDNDNDNSAEIIPITNINENQQNNLVNNKNCKKEDNDVYIEIDYGYCALVDKEKIYIEADQQCVTVTEDPEFKLIDKILSITKYQVKPLNYDEFKKTAKDAGLYYFFAEIKTMITKNSLDKIICQIYKLFRVIFCLQLSVKAPLIYSILYNNNYVNEEKLDELLGFSLKLLQEHLLQYDIYLCFIYLPDYFQSYSGLKRRKEIEALNTSIQKIEKMFLEERTRNEEFRKEQEAKWDYIFKRKEQYNESYTMALQSYEKEKITKLS